ncbi:STAS domain-containing protein [Actinomycetospora sp. C-140]
MSDGRVPRPRDPADERPVRSPWRSPDSVVLEVVGDVDLAVASSLLEAAGDELAGGRHVLVLDLAGVSFCSAKGITALIELRQLAHRHGATVRVVRPSRQVCRVASLVRCEDVLHDDSAARTESRRSEGTR